MPISPLHVLLYQTFFFSKNVQIRFFSKYVDFRSASFRSGFSMLQRSYTFLFFILRGIGELPNKRKGINFCQQPYKGRRAKGYPFPLLAKSFVICSRVPHLATFQKDSAFQKSTFLFRFVRDDTLNMNT